MTVPRSFKWCVFITLVLLGIIVLALWLDLRHQTPSVTIDTFSLPTSTNSKQHPDMYIGLSIKNPNKVYSIIYDYCAFTVNYSEDALGQTHDLVQPGFQQPKDKTTQVSDHVEADVPQWEAFLKATSNSSEVMLKVELKTGIRYQNLGHTSKKYNLKFHGRFNVGPDGKISGKKKVKLQKE
ncbi:hypothetical protein SOVF_201620 [Spinacia oleracea]|nr:hypothetical protein SOVF_201620 [Spinacia oleracea]